MLSRSERDGVWEHSDVWNVVLVGRRRVGLASVATEDMARRGRERERRSTSAQWNLNSFIESAWWHNLTAARMISRGEGRARPQLSTLWCLERKYIWDRGSVCPRTENREEAVGRPVGRHPVTPEYLQTDGEVSCWNHQIEGDGVLDRQPRFQPSRRTSIPSFFKDLPTFQKTGETGNKS